MPVFWLIVGIRYVFQNTWKFAPETVSTTVSVLAAREGLGASPLAANAAKVPPSSRRREANGRVSTFLPPWVPVSWAL
jgi:hypothetical protein